ncbi:MAG: bifunctional folylpolyglutamate synthase/dihydrofolate synthase [Bacteroidaceae bacterium]|nr:bifunctional folylpolyglutamate synthase/dihydrofolate synthase [Bacteroidaceae bacterium]
MFQNVGSNAYKEGLENTHILDEHFGHPHTQFRAIHVAGTNGKGSCSHTIASVLQEAGYKVGLFTSPHLTDFRERIRVNGTMIPEQYVMDFIDNERDFFEPLHPTFFELTTALAFKYFAEQKVDVAVIEVGLGGRLDCTNIITPDISIITNISFDHVQYLGDTLAKIAGEKAGIIKHGVPVIIGEKHPETTPVFTEKAKGEQAPLYFAEEYKPNKDYQYELKGLYQSKNLQTSLCAIDQLIRQGYHITEENIQNGLLHITHHTGLRGRWQIVRHSPTVICDTGHNVGGITYIAQQLKEQKCQELRIVFGMVSDKDVNSVLELMPQNAKYYFCQASVKRAMPHQQLKRLAKQHNLQGNSYKTVENAYKKALSQSNPNDCIFVGGSTFVVADFLCYEEKNKVL